MRSTKKNTKNKNEQGTDIMTNTNETEDQQPFISPSPGKERGSKRFIKPMVYVPIVLRKKESYRLIWFITKNP